MLRQALVAALLAGVALLGLDAQALACDLSCAAEAQQSRHDSGHKHSHHHSDAASESADLQVHTHALQAVGKGDKGDIAFTTDQHVPVPPPGCVAADRVTLNVQIANQAPEPLYHVAALVDSHVSAERLMVHRSPSEFDSPPYAPSASHHSSTPLRI